MPLAAIHRKSSSVIDVFAMRFQPAGRAETAHEGELVPRAGAF